ncbi:MAG: T9SS type A sorting domain-containing protein, partial [candidate division WOR-3 bacterium]
SFNLGVAYSVIPTSDNCFAIAGSVAGDIYLLKIDASGNPLWAKRYGNGGVPYEYAYSLIQTSDGGFAIAGYTESFGAGDQDFFVVKTDPSGNMEWARTFGSETLDIAYSIVQTPDGGYAISGYTLGFGTLGSDFLIIRLNASGNLLWAKTVGITDMWEYAGFMALCSDGGYILVGEGIGGFLSVKLNPSGNLDWAITLGGGLIKEAYSVIQDPDGNYTLAGWGRTGPPYDFCIVRVGADGSYPGCANPVNLPAEDVSLTETSPAVTVANPGTNFSVLSLTVTTPALNIADVCVPLGLENQEASCLPGVICSPLPEGALFNSSVNLSIRIYSSDGRLVRSGNLRKGHNRIPLETGVYFWQAEQFKGKVVVR